MQFQEIKDGVLVGTPHELPHVHSGANGTINGFHLLALDTLRETFGEYPVTKEPLGENQQYGEPVLREEDIFYPVIDMPDEEVEGALINKNKMAAEKLRDGIEFAKTIKVLDETWVVDDRSQKRMAAAVNGAEWTGADPSETIDWTLENNQQRATTVAELKQVLLAYAFRMKDVHDQYKVWRKTNMLELFIYVEPAPEV